MADTSLLAKKNMTGNSAHFNPEFDGLLFRNVCTATALGITECMFGANGITDMFLNRPTALSNFGVADTKINEFLALFEATAKGVLLFNTSSTVNVYVALEQFNNMDFLTLTEDTDKFPFSSAENIFGRDIDASSASFMIPPGGKEWLPVSTSVLIGVFTLANSAEVVATYFGKTQ